MAKSEEKDECVICHKETTTYCPFCNDGWGKTFYCSEHYRSAVESGNCCRGAEEVYNVEYAKQLDAHFDW